MPVDGRTFYVAFEKDADGTIQAYKVSSDLASARQKLDEESLKPTPQPKSAPGHPDFAELISTFNQSIEIYRRSVPAMMIGTMELFGQAQTKRVLKFCEEKGTSIDAETPQENQVFEVDYAHIRSFSELQETINSISIAIDHLPQIMIIGLVSVYDYFLSKLLKIIFDLHQELILTSEREIKFSELVKYDSVVDIKASIIAKEVESLIRESHQEQFTWMERKFRMKLRQDLHCWPAFIEICERRNLFTHTGGIVSAQYIFNCKDNNCDIKGIKENDLLQVDSSYFKNAVNVVAEIGNKLAYVMWRKFAPSDSDEADKVYSGVVYELIEKHEYKTAEELAKVGIDTISTYSGKENIRRRLIVNCANAIRLQKRGEDAKSVLSKEDWSASGYDFQVCVAAVNGEIARVRELMLKIGATGDVSKDDYRRWPVFRQMESQTEFVRTFEEIFGEPFILPETVISKEPRAKSDDSSTIH